MAYLIPFLDGTNDHKLSAVYNTNTKLLIVTAKGEIAGFWLGPTLRRDHDFVGGLKYLFEGFPGGLGEKGGVEANKSAELFITLPMDYFNSKSVVVETGSGTTVVEIHYTGFGNAAPALGSTSPAEDDVVSKLNNLRIGSVLPPIKEYLPGDGLLSIKARVPHEIPSSVDIRFNPEFLEIVSSGITYGDIYWTLKWKKFPTKDDNPQVVDVDTIRGTPLPPPNPITVFKVTQGYIVYGVLL